MAAREDVGSFVEELPATQPKVQRANGAVITQQGENTIVDLNPVEGEAFQAPEMDPSWHANLADQLTPTDRHAIADQLLEYVVLDKQVREHHFRRIKDGLELLGLKDLPESDTPFDGAASVTDPLIGEAVVQFQSRAIEELFPADGPVKSAILGEVNEEKERQAERLEDYMNYQLTVEDQGYFWDVDQMLFYLPMSGSAFKKIYIDPITEMTTSRYVTAEDFIVPYYCKDLKSATRYAHEYTMEGNNIKRAQVDGQFLKDAFLIPSPQIQSDKNVSFTDESMEDVADDRVPIVHEDDQVYKLYEYHIDYEMPFTDDEVKTTDIAPPYIITIEEESREVLSVRRNWKKGDEKYRKRLWFSHYKFLPGLGFYGFGYLHIIGALAKAASGSLRAILDTAALSNLPGGFKSKKAKISGEHRFTLGEFRDVDMSPEDLQQAFLPLPVKEPSPALATTYENLITRGKEFMGTTEVITGGADNRGPVGTTLALIEQAGKPQSAIHKRLHKAMREELTMMAQLNYELMDRDEYPYELGGESKVVLKQDFDGRVDVIPVSDPNIFSSVQRIAQSQGILELVESAPDLYGEKGRKEAHRRMLAALKTPEIDKLLPEDATPKNLDPVSENQMMATGLPVQVRTTQDDESHMAVHQTFAEMLAIGDPDLWKQIEPVFMSHKMEHLVSQYRKEVEQMLGMDLPPFDLYDEAETEDLPPEIEVMLSQAIAAKQRQKKQQEEQERGGPPPSPEEAEAQAIEDAKDAETIQKLERMKAEHNEKQREATEKHAQEMDQKQAAFEAEEARKDDESEADIEREKKLAAAKRTALVRPPSSRSRTPERETNRVPKKKKKSDAGADAR
jgi:hypothetical protein